ncbi:MAG: hypothetical protein HY866_07585 [Chloroflexi bacterium]|nr:hypothetical protein [Chloroflexota bacterium]
MSDLPDLTTAPIAALLRLHSDILEELRHRDVLRSANNPTGDYGEFLFKQAYGWELEDNSYSGYDATDSNGTRYQIKCRRISPPNASRQLSAIRNLPDKPFDFLAGVLLDQHYRVIRAAIVPFSIVKEYATYVEHVNAWRLMLRDSIWDIPEVQDVTHKLKAIEVSL